MENDDIKNIKPELFTNSPAIRPPEREEIDAIQKITEFEQSLSEFSEGDYMTVSRLQPHELRGSLERIYFSKDDPIDLDYLKKKWGGHLLRIRIYGDGTRGAKTGFDIPLFSFPPRVDGRLIENEDQKQRSNQPSQSPLEFASAIVEMAKSLIPQASPAQIQPQGLGIVDILKLANSLQRQSQPPDAVSQLRATMGLLKEVQGIGFGGGGDAGDGDMLSRIATIAEKVLGQQQNNGQPTISGPQLPPPPRSIGPSDVMSFLGKLSPEEIGNIVQSYVSTLDDNKREGLISVMLPAMGLAFGDPQDDSDIEKFTSEVDKG
jgi:hypothetical protein